LIDRIDRATTLAESASRAMHNYNLGTLTTPFASQGRFRKRMARIKQHQVERLTRWIQRAFDRARNLSLDELTGVRHG
jgi:hypothetical protein